MATECKEREGGGDKKLGKGRGKQTKPVKMKYIDWLGGSLCRHAGPKGRILHAARSLGAALSHLRRRRPTRTQPITNHSSGKDKNLKYLAHSSLTKWLYLNVSEINETIRSHHSILT
jgi:hypothetical protein